MATCEEIELRLLELLRERPPEDLIFHLQSCPNCREKQEQWVQIWTLMDQWEEEKPSDHVTESILSQARTSLRREEARWHSRLWRNLSETLVPLFAATAMAFLGVTLGAKKIGPALESLSPLALLICGVVWTATYGCMFFLCLERVGGSRRIQGIPVNLLAKYALGALGISLLFSGVATLSGVERLAAGFLSPKVGLSSYFLVGAAYSLIPLASVSLFSPGKQLSRASVHGVLLGVFFLFLLAPEIFLYCSSFSLGIAFNWTVGTIVGCVIGGPAGVCLGKKRIEVMQGS